MKGRTNCYKSDSGQKTYRTTILLDQTITDTATMVTKVYDDSGIAMIRNNSHRYVCKLVDGVLEAKQLQDGNGTLYLDGTTADLTGGEGDVMMKLPQFYYRATEQETDKWLIDFVYGEIPSDDYKVWDGSEFIGVYEATALDSNLYSRSGVESTGNVSQSTFKTYARNRGDGYTLVKWNHHCIMAFLFYAYYANTNSQAICGSGVNSYNKVNGQTDSLGMEDSLASLTGNSKSINFWGLENWWGNKYEWIDNVVVNKDGSNGVFTIEDDGLSREIQCAQNMGYVSKLAIGDNLDALPIELNGSSDSGFCDQFKYASDTNRVARRSNYINVDTGGITCIFADYDDAMTYAYYGSRLAYRGEYKIV